MVNIFTVSYMGMCLQRQYAVIHKWITVYGIRPIGQILRGQWTLSRYGYPYPSLGLV